MKTRAVKERWEEGMKEEGDQLEEEEEGSVTILTIENRFGSNLYSSSPRRMYSTRGHNAPG